MFFIVDVVVVVDLGVVLLLLWGLSGEDSIFLSIKNIYSLIHIFTIIIPIVVKFIEFCCHSLLSLYLFCWGLNLSYLIRVVFKKGALLDTCGLFICFCRICNWSFGIFICEFTICKQFLIKVSIDLIYIEGKPVLHDTNIFFTIDQCFSTFFDSRHPSLVIEQFGGTPSHNL